MSDDADASVPFLNYPAESQRQATFKVPSEASLQGVDRRRSSIWAPTPAQEKRKRNINSLINATSLPIFIAIFVAVVNKGDSFTFYETLLPLSTIGMLLQVAIALASVCKDYITYDQSMALDLEAAAIQKGKRVQKPTFEVWIRILTVLSLANSLTVSAFFSAQKMKD
jgi:hypothetical protein